MLQISAFCDICNNIEQTRSVHLSDAYARQLTDHRSWFECPLPQALKAGWKQERCQCIHWRYQDRHH